MIDLTVGVNLMQLYIALLNLIVNNYLSANRNMVFLFSSMV